MRDGRSVTVEVTADGAGLVSHAGSALLGQVADTVGLTRALSTRLGGVKRRRRGHDPGRVIRDLAVMLADGGECVSDLAAVREQQPLFGEVASDATAFRMLDRIANEPGMLEALRMAHATARERFWELSWRAGAVDDRRGRDVDHARTRRRSGRRGPTSMATGFTRSPPIRTRRAKRSRSCCGRGTPGRTPLLTMSR